MTPLPSALGGRELVAWRLDQARFARDWDSGEGAYRVGGRWNSRGVRAVYCSIDPATAILEVAAHKGFDALDMVPHVLTSMRVEEPAAARVLLPDSVADSNWLKPGITGADQQMFGDALLATNGFLLVPSVVSNHSWNLVFVAAVAGNRYALRLQEQFVLDPRLHLRRNA